MLASDHGFFWKEGRPDALSSNATTTAAKWHRSDGMYVVWRPGVKKTGPIAHENRGSVQQVCATLLALLGLPPGRDVEGEPLQGVHAPALARVDYFAAYHPPSAPALADTAARDEDALAKLKSYLDYGTFQPIQIAATVAMNEAPDFPKEVNEIYRGRRDALIDGLARIGWHIERPKGTMFVWARIPEPYAELTSLEFATLCVQEAKVALSPGSGFGPGGEGFIRFALVENEQRIQQAVRHMRKGLTKLG